MTVDLSSLCDVQNVLVTLTVCVASGEEVRMDSRSFCAVAFVKVKAKAREKLCGKSACYCHCRDRHLFPVESACRCHLASYKQFATNLDCPKGLACTIKHTRAERR